MIHERFEMLPDGAIRRHRAIQTERAEWVEVELGVWGRRMKESRSFSNPAECPSGQLREVTVWLLEHWSLTTLPEKLIKIGAKVVRRAKYVTSQMAEVAVPRALFAVILDRIQRFGVPPPLVQRS